jgi:hippurate hydrolase
MFDGWYRDHETRIMGWLTQLHARPEIGFEEVETARMVEKTLHGAGFEVTSGIGGTGVVGRLHGRAGAGRRIGLRAELDALPMTEASGLPYTSQIPDRFHGCGHDGHSVTLLTAACHLAETRDFAGTLHVIFQPAEELLTGAAAMIDDGLFDRFPCDEIYALHNLPGLEPGCIGLADGAATASADNLDVVISAQGTHGSAPQTGQDAVLAAAAFVTTVQQLATRVIDARAAGVISFGRIEGGEARNVLPDLVRIEGTMRTTDTRVRDRLAQTLADAARAIELSHGVSIKAVCRSMVPPTANAIATNAAVSASAERALGAARLKRGMGPIMASEDFALMQAQVPGSFFFVGQDGAYPHDPAYVFDPAVIRTGAAIFVDLVKTRGAAGAI